MTYEFSMEKKTVAKMIAGLAVVGVLLFAAGVMVGAQWNQWRPGATEVADASNAADGETARTATTEPSPEPVAMARRRREEPSQWPADSPATQTSAPQTAPATNAPTESAKPAQDKPPDRTPPQPNYSVSISPTGAMPDAAPVRTTFAVQVGAFLKEENALRLRQELERKGYGVSILTDGGSAARWYAVRLGPYTDQAGARRAAANFAQQEKTKAVVRPFGIL